MEQKLVCIPEPHMFGEAEDPRLKKFLDDGWKIMEISAAGNSYSSRCWVLLER